VIASPWIGVCWHKLSGVDPTVSSLFGGMSDKNPPCEAVISILLNCFRTRCLMCNSHNLGVVAQTLWISVSTFKLIEDTSKRP